MKVTGKRSWAWLAALVLLAGMVVAGCAGGPSACAAGAGAQRPQVLKPEQAAAHIGERATVTGVVVSADYRPNNEGSPTFLDFVAPYPKPLFIALIWGTDRPKFGTPETMYLGQKISVTGKIIEYHGKPTIVVSEPGQIKFAP
ncbi:MAG: hypothetical protein ABSH19_07845 [Opitutales bacterium]|jgi:micrococcal nuclease